MPNAKARYVLETVQAPPSQGSSSLREIEPPKGYTLRDWRAFGIGGDDPWGYALILWERELG
jgi:hypothetical protein